MMYVYYVLFIINSNGQKIKKNGVPNINHYSIKDKFNDNIYVNFACIFYNPESV